MGIGDWLLAITLFAGFDYVITGVGGRRGGGSSREGLNCVSRA